MAENSENRIEHASLSLPKGGGAINGIGEKFQVNVATGTGGYSIPLPITPGRSGFAPSLGLSYDSGGGNSPFGLGWSVGVPSISRKTNKELPQYNDAEESDTFLLAGAEDLVPKLDDAGNRTVEERLHEGVTFTVYSYRPRIEGLFAKIERWVNGSTTHWRVTTKEGIISIYGLSSPARIADPANPSAVFKWLLEESFDLYGNSVRYEYKEDDITYSDHRAATNRYLKRVFYSPFKGEKDRFHFQLLFDYGEHRTDTPEETQLWNERMDPFSSHRAGFEIRTARRCENVLMLHNFPDGGPDQWELVKKLELTYDSSPSFSYLTQAVITGFKEVKTANGMEIDSKSLPPLKFTYSRAEIDPIIHQIDENSLENLPVGLDNRRWQWIDVYGEGLPGIAVRDGGTVLYKENLGNGTFGPLHTVAEFPNLNSSDSISLSDIDGDGNNEFTVKADGINGYYRFRKDHWESFTPIKQTPNIDMNNPNQKMIDLTGDGRADILITEDRVMRWYPSKGEEGYEESQVTPKASDENRGPALVFADALESIYLADMTGDGLTDILRIRNGEVAYWPNQGHGKFGGKVVMKNSPRLEESTHAVKQDYIKLGDIDGSGTTDLLYFGNGKVQYWFNESGNGFSEAFELPYYPPIDSLSSLSLIDLKGTGTLSLVWSSNRPGQGALQLSYIDLMKEKPHLITEVNNSMGNVTNLTYESSVLQYLRDKKEGTPWLTKLHFPVHVLTKVTTRDLIGNVSQISSTRYRHGYFDSQEREFRGFGAVESIDSKSYEEYVEGGGTEEYVAPILTKQWFHTGGFDFDTLSKQYEKEYYQGDKDEFCLPDTVIEDRETLTTDELIEAHRALKSAPLRSEVYELGTTNPYSVSETNGVIRMIQPKKGNRHAVFMTLTGESIAHAYDQNQLDPRISHQFALDVDDYGVVRESASVIYPRRAVPGRTTEQEQTAVTLSVNDVDHRDNSEMFRIGVPIQSMSYEIGQNLPIKADTMVTREQLTAWVTTCMANPIPFDGTFDQGGMNARLLSWGRNYYWDTLQEKALPLGEYTEKLLVHHQESARFNRTLIDSVFDGRITDKHYIDSEYVENPDDKYFWDFGLIQHYQKSGFHLPYRTTEENTLNWVEVTFDQYDLSVVQTEDNFGNISKVEEMDYRTLQPKRLVDPNGNIGEAVSDALGMVIATTAYGYEITNYVNDTTYDLVSRGDRPIDEYLPVPQKDITIQDVVKNPAKYVQNASSFIYYDMEAALRGEPLQSISVARSQHVSDVQMGHAPSPETDYMISIGYSDGFGRELQSKVLIKDKGPCWVRVDDTYEKQVRDERWITSGRTVYNNKEKPVKQYEPFYSETFEYEEEEFFAEYGITPIIHYDPLGRVALTELPDGSTTKVETTPWEIVSYDQNDLDSNSEHFNTPSVVTLDSLGRQYRHEVFLENRMIGSAKRLVTKTEFNFSGQPVAVTDPRNIVAFTYQYDMAGTPLHTHNVDGGDDYIFLSRFGQPIVSFDTKETKVEVQYDNNHRPRTTTVTEKNKQPRVNSSVFYGDTDFPALNEEDLQNRNMRGQMWQSLDDAGCTRVPFYSFKGEVTHSEYLLRFLDGNYESHANWKDYDPVAGSPELEAVPYYSRSSFDALGRVLSQEKPDESVTTPEYHYSGTLKSVNVQLKNEAEPKTYVKEIKYNEKGQRESITYGNSTKTTYKYDPKTYRLTELRTFRESNTNEFLQEIYYEYDLVGNITSIEDKGHATVFNAGFIVEPKNVYTYDALYRLKTATGREKTGLTKEQHSKYTELYHTAITANKNDGQAVQSYSRQYEYDSGNNLTQIKQDGVEGFTRKIQIAADSNRGVSAEMAATPGDVGQFFDLNGNLKEMEYLESLEWDYQNMISKAKNRAGGFEYYIYSGMNRVRKITVLGSGEERETIYLGGCELKRISQASGTQILKRWDSHIMDDTSRIATVNYWEQDSLGRENDLPVTKDGPSVSKIRYQYGNHLGSASLELDKDGGFVSYQEYFPFGGTSYTVGKVSSDYRFTGKELDEFTGLYYFGARYYASWLGRWTAADPKRENEDGINLYQYCRNSPVLLTDPDGMTSNSQNGGNIDSQNGSTSSEKKNLKVYLLWSFDESIDTKGMTKEEKKEAEKKLSWMTEEDKATAKNELKEFREIYKSWQKERKRLIGILGEENVIQKLDAERDDILNAIKDDNAILVVIATHGVTNGLTSKYGEEGELILDDSNLKPPEITEVGENLKAVIVQGCGQGYERASSELHKELAKHGKPNNEIRPKNDQIPWNYDSEGYHGAKQQWDNYLGENTDFIGFPAKETAALDAAKFNNGNRKDVMDDLSMDEIKNNVYYSSLSNVINIVLDKFNLRKR